VLEHPAEQERTRFDRIAEFVSNATSTPVFFALVMLLGLAWGGAYAFGGSDALKHFLEGAMAFLSLVLVAILKNSERRAEGALHIKLDALLAAELQRQGHDTGEHAVVDELREARGKHDEV
jgi:low affinity Fe/Cu permease